MKLIVEIKECIGCEYCDAFENKCLITGDRCYEKGECLISDCENYKEADWRITD